VGRSRIKTKGIYGKPWSRLAKGIPVSRKVLEQVGQILVDTVIAEARRDIAKGGGLPDTERFLQSFSYQIRGKSTVEVVSDWPQIMQIMEGRRPYPMDWLNKGRRKGDPRRIVPIIDKGTILFRMAPLVTEKAWIHPGIARNTFIQRGIRKGRQKAAEVIVAEVANQLKQGNPFR
jgi:hypothetical protein